MSTVETLTQPRANGATSQMTAVEQARAVAEVAAAVKVAQDNPRDVTRAVARMRQSCEQQSLADRAFYSLPRAGGRVEGSTVHLARELAACWGNCDYGVRELRRDDQAGESEMQAWAWDQETNVRSSRSFIVPHDRMVGKGAAKKRERLIDLGDIANNNNSVAARAVRETIFTILPVWFVSDAETLASKTLRGDTGADLAADIRQAVAHFGSTYGITAADLERAVEMPQDRWTGQTVGYLRVLDGELGRGEKRPDDFTGRNVDPGQPQTADALTARADTAPTDGPNIPGVEG